LANWELANWGGTVNMARNERRNVEHQRILVNFK